MKSASKVWYWLNVRFAGIVMGAGSDHDRLVGAHLVFVLAAAWYVYFGFFTGDAYAVTDLNGAASNLQSGFQSGGRALYYGMGGVGLATAGGGFLHLKHAAKTGDKYGPGLVALGAGAGLTGIGTYLAFFNQSSVQDTGGMSTNSMGIPQ